MAIERRRSDRIMLTIPLVAHGTDVGGASFKEAARSVALNRHGARIQISRPLTIGQTLRLVNQVTHREAEFRVIGPVAPLTDRGGEWAVECINIEDNIWGIQFPPGEKGEATDSRALLECRKCHTVALLPVSLVEVDVLETSGIISKRCQNCKTISPWGYAEKEVAMESPPEEAAMLAEAQDRIEEAPKAADRRRHRRVCLQLPVLVRDYYGGVEITKTENASKGGFCFASEKNYYVGQGIMVICPYSAASQNIDAGARIVRRRDVEGTQRKLYGVRYEAKAG